MPGIPSPVPGGTFTDTFGAPRSGGRKHAGVDIFAPKGSPVLAPVAGTVTVAGPSGGLGGTRVWVHGDDGRFYYFAHLNDVTTLVGKRVNVGALLGHVGQTGNAEHSSPHLHFSINGHQGGENPVVNPYSVIDKSIRYPSGAGASHTSLPTDETASSSTSSSSSSGDGCLLKFPGVAGAGKFCILSESQGRAIVGALCIVGGGLVFAAGVAIIAAYGLESNTAANLLKKVGGPPGRAAADQQLADVRAQELEARSRSAEARTRSADARIIKLNDRRNTYASEDNPASAHTFADGSTF